MTQFERKELVMMLNIMQKQLEVLSLKRDEKIVIEIPGTKYVYKGRLKTRVALALARVMENEKYSILNNHQ